MPYIYVQSFSDIKYLLIKGSLVTRFNQTLDYDGANIELKCSDH